MGKVCGFFINSDFVRYAKLEKFFLEINKTVIPPILKKLATYHVDKNIVGIHMYVAISQQFCRPIQYFSEG